MYVADRGQGVLRTLHRPAQCDLLLGICLIRLYGGDEALGPESLLV